MWIQIRIANLSSQGTGGQLLAPVDVPEQANHMVTIGESSSTRKHNQEKQITDWEDLNYFLSLQSHGLVRSVFKFVQL